MSKYKVSSGEFEVIIHETTNRKAADLAIQLHNKSNSPTKLGEITMIEKLDRNSRPTEDRVFIATQILIDSNTEEGQYSRLEEC